MGIGGDRLGYLGQMQVHRRGVAEGQDETRRFAFGRADRAEDIDRLGPLIVWGRWPRPAPGPTSRAFILLADSGLISEPDLYALARRPADRDLRQAGGEVFLKTAAASRFCAWWRGRAESLR
jgi:hypothetical protein